MSKRKLLLADDSVTIQKVVNLTFADEGIEVITVGDGDSAMEKISEISPDVVLADVHMPGLSGYQICEILRDNPATKHLPVVLLVGSFEPFDENEAARVGANAFLTKPFQSIRQLVSQVSELMEKAPTGEVVQADDYASFADTDENLSTAVSLPEADVQERPAPVGGSHDTSDIENLYQQSFGASAADTADSPFVHSVDAGMDDEMIEMSHGDDGVARTELESQVLRDDSDFEERSPNEDEYRTEPTVTSPFDSPARVEDEGPIVEEPSQTESYFEQFAPNEEVPTLEQHVSDAMASSLELDEVDLLELPPLAGGKTVELTTIADMVEQGTKKQVMSLSPELMDIIVQKVVDKLSEK